MQGSFLLPGIFHYLSFGRLIFEKSKKNSYVKKNKNLTIPRALLLCVKKIALQTYGRELYETVILLETKTSDLVSFSKTKKHLEKIRQGGCRQRGKAEQTR